MAGKLSGSAIQSGTITINQLSSTVNDTSNAAYNQANNSYGQANLAYTQANSAYGQANNAYGQTNLAYTQANNAYTAANNSNLKLGGVVSGTLNVTQDIIVGGNIYLEGNTTYINVATYTVEDPLIYLASNNSLTDSVDIGFMGGKNTSGTYSHTGLARDATDGKWKLFDKLADEGHVGNVIDFANTTVATLVANVEANTVTTSANLTVGAGSASVPSITTAGDLNTGIFFPTADTIAFTKGGTEAARIDASGNFGIGTTSPSYKLHIDGASAGLNLSGGNNRLYYSGYRALEGATDGTILQVGESYSTVRLYGLVGIGTSSPLYKLQIAGTSGTVGLALTGTHAAGDIGLYIAPSTIIGSYTAIEAAPNASTGAGYNFKNANTTSSSAHSRVDILVGGASGGDPKLTYTISGVLNWSVGVDNSDSDKFKISASDSPGSSDLLTITSGGLVGIGTNSPGTRLHIKGAASADTFINVEANATNDYSSGIKFSDSNTDGAGSVYFGHYYDTLYVGSTGTTVFNNNSAERARIDSSGRLNVNRTTGGGTVNIKSQTNNFAMEFYHHSNDASVGSITTSTTATTYGTSSDYRLKNITGPVTGAREFIMSLQPKQGTWKADGSKFVGFVAHEFQEVSPSSVVGVKDAVDEEGNPVMQTMQSSSPEVMANLVALIQEQQAMIEDLKTKVAALENK